MRSPSVRLVALFLIPILLWVGSLRGQALCLPLAECGQGCAETGCTNEAERAHSHGGCAGHTHHSSHASHASHVHERPVGPEHPDQDDCGCHVHLPFSSDSETTVPPSASTAAAAACGVLPDVCDMPAPGWHWTPSVPRPPDLRPAPHLAGWRATRLLI